ncbi:uncharacterized protein LOC128245516 [Mya arenaria]|uniref:uncharacterized protein LOC128245516 n=1 Tax=Mya arenaria TaxID=6604 RepID=UPI0022E022F2|nr:uncharacterized protein LOC128245516 [Mya arenaria]
MVIDVITIILTCFVIHVTTGGLNGCGSSLFQYQKHVRRDYERPSTEVFVTEQGVEICKTLDSKKPKAECYSASFAELNIELCGLFPKLSEYRSAVDKNDLQDNGDECCGTISAVIPYSNIELRNMTSANGDPCRIIQLYARATCGL